MSRDFSQRFWSVFRDAPSHTGPTSGAGEQFAVWYNAGHGRGGSAAADGAHFVYEPAHGSSGASPWFGEVHSQSASTPASEALHSFFDGWINTLASWTQSGSATIGPHHDPFQGGFLASGGGSEPTHGGWGSSSR
ncbi:hypothetical protein RNI52_19785 [Labrys neptuniae]|uniref:hypothetical protein n=1 Tax=Labrys neptuniae TaxID=376174 RepID=UPI00288D4612|nr:hypothetical protein [Labrys neptuniae]MDT3379582.1 hypothetical protein [Labrys neptuniae]